MAAFSSLTPALTASAAAVYIVSTAAARRPGGQAYAKVAVIVAWLLHGAAIAAGLFAAVPHFGFAPALSVTLWLVIMVYLIERHFYPQLRSHWAVTLAGGASVILAAVFPGRPIPVTGSPLLPLHFASGVSAYGMFAAAVIHARMMRRAEERMRRGEVQGDLPVLTLERLMFRFVWAGFILLTCTVAAGALFGQSLYGDAYTHWRIDHKRVFTVMSWAVFAVLLIGRKRFGWRGRRAVWGVNAGALFLLLGYVGSRFVFEVLLKR